MWAKPAGKRLVIATATVALQEQIVYKDLPDLMRNSGLNFSFALAKGRGRYMCLSKLDMLLQEGHALPHRRISLGIGCQQAQIRL